MVAERVGVLARGGGGGGGGGQRRFDICFFLKASLTWQLILCHSLEIGWSLTIPENITDAF